jgi:hypothetical protein
MGDGIFESALWVGSYETNSDSRGRIEGVWKCDFARLKPLVIDNVFFGGENQPNWDGNW